MTKKRYAIVRGQRKCLYYEVISKKCLLDLEDCSKECINIKGKFQYGDTKAQLIRKVATVLRRILKVDVCSYKYKGKMRKLETIRFKGKGRFDEIVIELEEVAKKIVEFLGVEE